jgi:type III secretory pathway component EscR
MERERSIFFNKTNINFWQQYKLKNDLSNVVFILNVRPKFKITQLLVNYKVYFLIFLCLKIIFCKIFYCSVANILIRFFGVERKVCWTVRLCKRKRKKVL